MHTPHLADVEVAQALRRYVREGALGATLVTCDGGLARAPGIGARVELVR